MKHLLKQYTWILGLAAGLLLLVLLTGCNQAPFTQGPMLEIESHVEQPHTESEYSYTPNFQGIADMLGCVFAPDSCER